MMRVVLVPESQRVETLLRDRLAQAFESAGWTTERPVDGQLVPDLLVSKARHRYAVQLRVSTVARRQILQALLADALLQARATARVRYHDNVRPLAVVGAPTLTAAMIESLREYASLVAPDDAYGWIDGTGRTELLGDGLQEVRGRVGRHLAPVAKYAARTVHDAFTDLNQWLLKVLLAPGFPPELLSGPRMPVRDTRELAEVAKVSIPSASRFVAALEERHHLARDHDLRVVRVSTLLSEWRITARRSAIEVPMRWILRPADPQARVAELARAPFDRLEPHVTVENREGFLHRSVQWERGPRMCLALFSACDALGYGIVRGVPRHVYMEPYDPELLRKFGLAPAEGADRIDVVVRKPRFPEAVFRGAVLRGGVPVSDAIQTWLDVVDHPARGNEQGAHLWDRAILPHVQRDEMP